MQLLFDRANQITRTAVHLYLDESIVLPIVTAERIHISGRLLVQSRVTPPFDLGRHGPCARYVALAAPVDVCVDDG